MKTDNGGYADVIGARGGEEVCDARATVTREVGGRRRASGPSPGAPRRCASGTKVTCARRDTHSRESDWGSSKGGGYGLRRGRKQDTPGGDRRSETGGAGPGPRWPNVAHLSKPTESMVVFYEAREVGVVEHLGDRDGGGACARGPDASSETAGGHGMRAS